MSDSPKAQIGLPEVRLGIFPAWGGCTRLPRVVGLAAALDLILTGKSLDARRAKKIGLVDEAVPAAIFDDWARRFAREKLGGGKPRSRRRPDVARRRARSKATPLGRRVDLLEGARGRAEADGRALPGAARGARGRSRRATASRSRTALEAEARHIGHVFGGEVQRNLLAIFFLTEEVKKETGVADPRSAPRDGRARRRARRRASWAAASRSSRPTRAFRRG